MKMDYEAPVSYVSASGSAASVGRAGSAPAAKKESANAKKSASGAKGKKEPNASGYGVYDGVPCRIDIYANYIKITQTSYYFHKSANYSMRHDLTSFEVNVETGYSSELDKAFDRSYVINTINIQANALTDWSGTSIFVKPEFTFNRKNRELHTREQHTIKVFSPGFDEVLDDFANSHFHY